MRPVITPRTEMSRKRLVANKVAVLITDVT